MNRKKVITIALAGFAAAGAVFAAANFVGKSANPNEGKCIQTPDGKYVCKATGTVMDAPCCQKPDRR